MSSGEVRVSVEDDAVPFVRIMAARFRRAAGDAAFNRAVHAMNGSIGLRSSADPQQLTISVDSGNIRIERGIGPAVRAIITLDLDLGKPTAIAGWWRHPLLLFQASKLLADYQGDWQQSARQFWRAAGTRDGMPPGILVRCTDDDTEIQLGNDTGEVEIEGKSIDLSALFGGDSILFDALIKRRLRAASSMQHLAVISEATLLNLLGEL